MSDLVAQGGHLVARSANLIASAATSPAPGCCCGGGACATCTSISCSGRTIGVTFSGVTMAPCQPLSPTSSYKVTAGSLNGTWCLALFTPQTGDDSCAWLKVTDSITVTQYSDDVCGTVFDASVAVTIRVALDPVAGKAYVDATAFFPQPYGGSFPVFSAGSAGVDWTPGCTSITINNWYTAWDTGGGAPSSPTAGWGGQVTIDFTGCSLGTNPSPPTGTTASCSVTACGCGSATPASYTVVVTVLPLTTCVGNGTTVDSASPDSTNNNYSGTYTLNPDPTDPCKFTATSTISAMEWHYDPSHNDCSAPTTTYYGIVLELDMCCGGTLWIYPNTPSGTNSIRDNVPLISGVRITQCGDGTDGATVFAMRN